jgi:hypothetical protein
VTSESAASAKADVSSGFVFIDYPSDVYDTYVAIKTNTATYVFTHGSVIALTVMGFHFNQTPAALLGLVGRIRSVVSWKASTRGVRPRPVSAMPSVYGF